MSIVRDMSLAESGRRKIEWVRDFMPVLSGIEQRFEQEKPFDGLRVAVSVHLEAKTANLGYVLQKGGAEVRVTGSNPLSTQDDVAAGLASMGVETFGIHGVTPEEYEDLLVKTLEFHPHLIIDDGGDLIDLLGGKCASYGDCLIGGCEETTTGIHRLKAREREGILPLSPGRGRHPCVSLPAQGPRLADRTVCRLIRLENRIYAGWTSEEQALLLRLNRDFTEKLEAIVASL